MDKKLPNLMLNTVKAGFPSVSESECEYPLDLNELMVKNAPSTFFVRVDGDSMQPAGIFENDILVVDRSLDPVDKSIVIACVNNEFTVKYFRRQNGKVWLQAANKNYGDIHFSGLMELKIFGVVTGLVRKFSK